MKDLILEKIRDDNYRLKDMILGEEKMRV